MLLATGDALVFSPAAVITADERGGVVLLGKDHLALRVRPRLTLGGGASLLAVGRSLPAPAASSVVSLMSPPTPLTSQSHFAERETRLDDTSTAPSVADPNPTVVYTTPFVPLSTPAVSLTGDTAAPSAPSVVDSQSIVSPLRVFPARLKHLVSWLSRSGAAERPLKLGEALGALHWVGKKEYTDMPKSQWRNQMLHEAVETGLIELINMDVKKKELKARGEEKMIRLLERGPFVYV
jgi:hypothetical protein